MKSIIDQRGVPIVAAAIAAFIFCGTSNATERRAYEATTMSGRVLDAKTNQPVAGAVVSAAWILRPVSGSNATSYSPRLHTEQVLTNNDGVFRLVGWSGKKFAPEGWVLIQAFDPIVRIYHNGYGHAEFPGMELHEEPRQQVKAGRKTIADQTIRLSPLEKERRSATSSIGRAQLLEWSIWKKHLEDEIFAAKWSNRRFSSAKRQHLLYELIESNCRGIDAAIQRQVCVEPTSETGRIMTTVTTPARHVTRTESDPRVTHQATDLPSSSSRMVRGDFSVNPAPAKR